MIEHKYVKRRIVITAVQFDGTEQHAREIGDAYGLMCRPRLFTDGWVVIVNLDGIRYDVNAGDWVLTDDKGGHYPCKNELFEQVYEPLVEGAT